MKLSQSVIGGIAGAFRVARGDFSGYEQFDQSANGFWRSFLAAPLLLPVRYILLLVGLGAVQTEANFVALEALAFLVDWLVFPLVMIFMTRMAGISHRYAPFVIAYNWTKLPIYIVVAIAMGIAVSGDAETINPVGAMLLMAASFWSLWLRWRIAKDMLEVPGLHAAAYVVLDTSIALIFTGLIGGMIPDPAAAP